MRKKYWTNDIMNVAEDLVSFLVERVTSTPSTSPVPSKPVKWAVDRFVLDEIHCL